MDTKLTRFGVSMEENLLKQFDEMINSKGYPSRSEAVRDFIRDALLQEKWALGDEIVAGTILLFYDHHSTNLVDEMMHIQHDYHEMVLASTHIHIDHNNCLEIIVVRGKPKLLKELSNRLIPLKGVFYGKLTVAPIAKN